MHSNIIPRIDDGVQTLNDSLVLAKKTEALGYKKLIAFPHIMADYFRNAPNKINRGLDILRLGWQDIQLDLRLKQRLNII